jgi:glycosyltransferase involved in cell wall biosynthesis
MKITIVLGAFFPVPPIMGGAVEKAWFALGQEFARRGHEVVQISRTHPSLPQAETIEGVRHIRVAGYAQPRSIILLKFFDLLYSIRARRVLPEADIVVTNTFWLPLLIRGHTRGQIYVHVARGPKGQMRWYRNAARLQAVSRAIGDAIIAQAPELHSKVRVLPHALPFRSPPFTPDSVREKRILFVGRIHPEKGLELLMRGLRSMPQELLGQWKIEIVGPHETELGGGGGEFLQRLQELAAESGIAVEFRGAIFDGAKLNHRYQAARVFVYPSLAEKGEALPVAPLEAMANGCVPLVSNLDCFRDYIENGVSGFLFDHRQNNPEENLATRMRDILSLQSDDLARIVDAARSTAAEFASDVVAEKYLEDFASLVETNVATPNNVTPSEVGGVTDNAWRRSRDSSLRSE